MVLLATKLIIILGFINITTALLLFLSCRCLPTSKIGATWLKNPAYKRFYKYHCYIWWIFWPSVALHAILVAIFLVFPF